MVCGHLFCGGSYLTPYDGISGGFYFEKKAFLVKINLMPELNQKTLEHLAELARIELKAGEEEKLLKDLQMILGHFEELQALDTSNVQPMTGGTDLKNVFREDEVGKTDDTGKGVDAFPESKDGFLKVPPIF